MSGFLSFCGWIIFHMYITHFLYPVTYRWRLGLPPYQEFLNLYEKDERFSEGRSIFSWPLQFQLPLSSQLLLLLLPKIIPLRIWPRVWLKIGGKNIYRVSSLGALCTLPHNVALSCIVHIPVWRASFPDSGYHCLPGQWAMCLRS